jgi:indole-3-glycerol phosphate synthase
MTFNLIAKIRDKTVEMHKLKERRSLYSAIVDAKRRGFTPVIGEAKRESPTLGVIRDCDVVEAAKQIEAGGACAVSVLTDNSFGGAIGDLRKVKDSVKIPVLRKDFIVDEYQICEACSYGADCILLIASILKEETARFVEKANIYGIESLVEVHSIDEIPYAIDSGAKLIGINNRDLETMKVDLKTTEKLIKEIPEDILKISESGINDRKDIVRLMDAGADAFLVGTSIMSSGVIKSNVRRLVGDDSG